jgi:uncharacterized protein YjhX (UPF0386 family)
MKKWADPLGSACSKHQLSSRGQNKITCWFLDWVLSGVNVSVFHTKKKKDYVSSRFLIIGR